MIGARRRDSEAKRARVLATIERMLAVGTPTTFAAVARPAKVSTWLVHAPGLREAITNARNQQYAQHLAEPAPDPGEPGLRTDLSLARAEITRLRAERDQQQQQIRLALGARLDDIAKATSSPASTNSPDTTPKSPPPPRSYAPTTKTSRPGPPNSETISPQPAPACAA